MKTDSLFYRLFKNQSLLVFELLGDVPLGAETYAFRSQEVKQTSFRMDGILFPPPHFPDLPLVFVEVQGYRDQKKALYPSFFTKIFLYLRDYSPVNDWRSVLIFTKRHLDPGLPLHYQDFANSPRFQRIYLDELPADLGDRSVELGILQLIGLREEIAPERAKQLIERIYQRTTDVAEQRRILELVVTVFVYKFPDLARQEIEAMLGLSELKETKFYQEIEQEVQAKMLLRAVPLLLKAGLTIEQIAEQLEVDVEAVRQAVQQSSEN